MYVCVCDALNNNKLIIIIQQYKIKNLKQIKELQLCDQCCKCNKIVNAIIRGYHETI